MEVFTLNLLMYVILYAHICQHISLSCSCSLNDEQEAELAIHFTAIQKGHLYRINL